MIIKSEKESYRDEFREIVRTKDEDVFLWGEELLDKKLVLYSGKIKEMSEYETFSDCLINCGLIVLNLQKGKVLKCITTRMNPGNNRIYIQDDAFNASWTLLRKSIDLGIRRKIQTEGQCTIEKPEDILDFECLIRKSSDPVLENGRIIYTPRKMSEKDIRLMGARQSALDNRKNLYFHSKDGTYAHDRDCQLLKKITDGKFAASPELPPDKIVCTNCAKILYIRIGCRSNNKEIPILNHIFTKHEVKASQLWKFIEEGNLEFHAKSLEEMTVIGEEDTWKIDLTNQNKLQLWHNNYVRTSPTERYITEGFHNQGIENASLLVLLRFIEGYSWKKHLQAENIKKEKQLEVQSISKICEIIEKNEPIKDIGSMEIRAGIWVKIKNWVKKLLHR